MHYVEILIHRAIQKSERKSEVFNVDYVVLDTVGEATRFFYQTPFIIHHNVG